MGANPQDVRIGGGYNNYEGQSEVDPNISLFSTGAVGFVAGTKGITHEKIIEFSSPVVSILEAHMGLPDQRASSMLVSQAVTAESSGGKFKLQNQADTNSYYTSNHKLLDTAYVAGKFSIGQDQTTIPSIDYVVKGKMIQAYNYDGSYKHSVQPGYSSESAANFKQGDTVTLRAAVDFTSGETTYSVDDVLASSKRILDKFFFLDHNGDTQDRFRWDLSAAEQTLLGEAKKFYMSDGVNEWHMVTYDGEDTDATDLTTVVTVAEVLTADLTQTSTGSDPFKATMSNISASNTADYTVTDADLVLYVPNDDVYTNISPFGANSFKKRTPVLQGNIANITGGTEIQLPGKTSEETLPAGTKVVVCNQLKLSSNASTTDDIYNGQKITFTRSFASSAAAEELGLDRLTIERTVVDYEGSTRLVTLDRDIAQGLIYVGDVTNFVGETSDRPNTEQDINKAGDLRPSTNLALITLDYVKSKRYGLQMEYQDLNLDDFLLAAVECDTQSDVTVAVSSVSGIAIGDIYEYRHTATGHMKWRGTVSSIDATNLTLTFTNVYGKLTNKWNDYVSREVGDLIWTEGQSTLRRIDTAGVQSSYTDNSSTHTATLYRVTGGGVAPNLTVTSEFSNPVREYSLYDSDDITYWKYIGWEEHETKICYSASRKYHY